MSDTFWQEQIVLHVANRGKHVDPSACGACRSNVTAGKQVEHDECAQRATLIEAPDAPDYELLIEMTEQERADLPARFHTPSFDHLGQPNAWLCAVCWGDGWATQWPCATAVKHGTQVFTPQHETEREQQKQQAEASRLRAEIAELRTQLATSERQAAELERALGLNEGAAA